jgi:hypothetical protein
LCLQPHYGGAEGQHPMLQIMLACTHTGQFVPTGIETDVDTFMALPEVLSLTRCSACGGNHYWTKAQTWIRSTDCSSPALLPAEVVCSH